MYKILLDQNKLFECDIKIEGATEDKTQVRLMLETENFSVCFKGSIKGGKVQVPINKLKNIIKENYKGKISLEVIADDTFFTPWSETYETDTYKKVEVSFSDKPLIAENSKPKVSVVLSEDEKHADNIINMLKKNNIKLKDITRKPSIVTEVMGLYLVNKNIPVKNNIKLAESILQYLMNKVICLK